MFELEGCELRIAFRSSGGCLGLGSMGKVFDYNWGRETMLYFRKLLNFDCEVNVVSNLEANVFQSLV